VQRRTLRTQKPHPSEIEGRNEIDQKGKEAVEDTNATLGREKHYSDYSMIYFSSRRKRLGKGERRHD